MKFSCLWKYFESMFKFFQYFTVNLDNVNHDICKYLILCRLKDIYVDRLAKFWTKFMKNSPF